MENMAVFLNYWFQSVPTATGIILFALAFFFFFEHKEKENKMEHNLDYFVTKAIAFYHFEISHSQNL